jgi:hypothetical protein
MISKRTTTEAAARRQRNRTIRHLSELIAALDRRVPQVERAGEASITRAAATLKDEAVKRLVDLERKNLQ